LKFLRWVCFIALLSTASSVAARDSLKIYISADMEGVVGVVTPDQLKPDGFEYQRFREFMTAEVNACIEAAREAGATEILVSDSHGNGENLLIEKMPDDVMIVRSWPRPMGMMEGIDETFDGVIFIGYHAGTDNKNGVRAHTMSSSNLTGVRLNGMAMSEASLNAAIAGHFGVPVIMVSGDDATIEETRELIGDVEGAVVKWANGFHSARTLTPEAGYAVIREKTRAAIARIDEFKPYVLKPPIELEVSLKNYRPVELLGYLKQVERVTSHTIRFIGEDMLETMSFFWFMLKYDISEQP
jgi:D-amino peptidase